MNSRQKQHKENSSRRCSRRALTHYPAIVLEVRRSRRLAVAWWCWCLALAAALAFGTDLKWWVRAALFWLLAWLAARGHRLLWLENAQPQRVSWGSDGRWQLQDARSGLRYVELHAPPRILGPLIWLPLAAGRRRLPLLIDTRYTEPAAVSALKARLKVHRR